MDKYFVPQEVLKRLVELTVQSCEMKETAMLNDMVKKISDELKLLLEQEREERLGLLKSEFNLRVKELKEYSDWKEYTKENFADFFEGQLGLALQDDKIRPLLTHFLSEREKSKFIRVDYVAVPTSMMLETATYRNRNTGREYEFEQLPKPIKSKLPAALPDNYSIYTTALKTEYNSNELIIYTSEKQHATAIVTEGKYLHINIGRFITPVAYRLALVSFIDAIRYEINKLVPAVEKENKRKKQSAIIKTQPKGNRKAIHWRSYKEVDGPEFNSMKLQMENKGYIDKIHGNTFKTAFRVTVDGPPPINWIGHNAMSHMLYFMYLIWTNSLAEKPKQKFIVIANCFKVKGRLITSSGDLKNLGSRYNQISNEIKGDEKDRPDWMNKMIKDMGKIIEPLL